MSGGIPPEMNENSKNVKNSFIRRQKIKFGKMKVTFRIIMLLRSLKLI